MAGVMLQFHLAFNGHLSTTAKRFDFKINECITHRLYNSFQVTSSKVFHVWSLSVEHTNNVQTAAAAEFMS